MQERPINKILLASYGDDVASFLKPIYASRSVRYADLDLSIGGLLKPNFANLARALSLLEDALISNKRILIVSDFDADGATACAVMIRMLRQMGAQFVDFLVPNRFLDGYGLSPAIVETAKSEKIADLIITVDNGIASIDGVKLAKSYGMEVIITDHHLPGEVLPKADAIINPNLKNCHFPSKHLAGVGVAFYLCASLKTHLLQKKYFKKQGISVPDIKSVLDLVALGTVADMVILDRNNRILVHEGLKRIQNNKACAGILALIEMSKRSASHLEASDLGFAIAPRINAAGRLSDMTIGIRCLITDDSKLAKKYVCILDNLNHNRRDIQTKMQDEAQAILEKKNFKRSAYSISLFDENWHEGVVGIVAGRLVRDYHCPSAVFAKNGAYLKGSIRSIKGVHIKDLLEIIDREHTHLIEKFGGHAMAAGITIKEKYFKDFCHIFDTQIRSKLGNQTPSAKLMTDTQLSEEEINLKNAQLIVQSGPWGQGFEIPIFYGCFQIMRPKIVGKHHFACQLKLINREMSFDAIAFFQELVLIKQAIIAYQLEINYYQGMESLQLIIKEITPMK